MVTTRVLNLFQVGLEFLKEKSPFSHGDGFGGGQRHVFFLSKMNCDKTDTLELL